MVGKPLLDCILSLNQLLKGVEAKWAIGGDAAEVICGVNVKPDRVTIVTTAEGCDEICSSLVRYQKRHPETREVTLERRADISGKFYPVQVRSRFGELKLEGSKVEVHGDVQIKVGDWDWGDSIDFEPNYVNVVGRKVPTVPLQLKTELYMGLGWLDRIEVMTKSLTHGRRWK
jgi:hypothetical protein